MIRMICVVRLVDTVLTDIFRDRVGVILEIKDMIIQSRLRCSIVLSCLEISIPNT